MIKAYCDEGVGYITTDGNGIQILGELSVMTDEILKEISDNDTDKYHIARLTLCKLLMNKNPSDESL